MTLSTTELSAKYDELRNWGRWGDDDEAGTLRFITPQRRVKAAGEVRHGVTVSLAHDLLTAPTDEQPVPVMHHMLAGGDALDASGVPGYEATRDFVGLEVHGLGTTHLDALCHMFVDGQMYNGRPASAVTSTGAEANTVMTVADGIVGRGVLLDIPGLRGVDALGPDDRVTAADLEAAEQRQSVTVGSGDLLIVSTGRDARRQVAAIDPFEDGLAGLDGSCLQWLYDREVAMLAGDGISDPMPAQPDPKWPFPIHQIAITGMGMHLIDNCRLDDLLVACRRYAQWSFLLTINPLRIPGGTGCPVNPLAVL
ncbi:MAG TPA: cyclase family protein [Mycobacteriales bacterium]|nr:cyclase family protein [Mycobacteriales bacterium]